MLRLEIVAYRSESCTFSLCPAASRAMCASVGLYACFRCVNVDCFVVLKQALLPVCLCVSQSEEQGWHGAMEGVSDG